MLLTIISFLILLGVLMFFHELGHYLVARRSGIEVEEFGVFGFPPRLVRLFTYDGTVFSVNAIPFGAFVRMKGEDMADMSPGSFNAARARDRALTLLAGPAMNLLLAILFSIASVLSGYPARAAHPLIEEVQAGGAADALGLRAGDVLLALDGKPVYIDTSTGDYLQTKTEPSTGATGEALVVRNGSVLAIPTPAGPSSPQEIVASVTAIAALTTQITLVVEDTPAARAGLQAGDIVYTVNGEPVTPDRTLGELIREHLGETVALTLLRDDRIVALNVLARAHPPAGQGAMGVAIDGIPLLVSLPLLESIRIGIANILDYVRMVLALPVMLILGQLAPSDAGVAGPLGIAQLVGGAVNATVDTGLWFPIWQLAAVISAGLAVANMLPIPALDGGRLLFIAIEKLRGRRLDPEKEGLIHLVGFMLLLGLMVIVTISDIRSGPQGIDWSRLLGQ